MITEEEEKEIITNEIIKSEMAEGLIPIYQDPDTDSKLKQKIIDELFDRLVRLESIEQLIINRRLRYEKWLNERGYFGAWDTIEDLTKGKDAVFSFGVAAGIYDVCSELLKMMERNKGISLTIKKRKT